MLHRVLVVVSRVVSKCYAGSCGVTNYEAMMMTYISDPLSALWMGDPRSFTLASCLAARTRPCAAYAWPRLPSFPIKKKMRLNRIF